jgi:sporulation protein YlmC with PRC-barrel domain
MKTLLLPGVMIAILGLAMASTFAQTQSTTVQVSKLVGTKVKSSQGEEIGVVKDVVIDRNSGCMAYTVLSTGGGGARATGGGKFVAVPWAVYSPTADVSVLTVTVDRERIYSAPVFDYARIEEYSGPDYITNVYSYYGVSQGAAAGAAVSGATTTTGAAGSPGAAASPPTAASPAVTESPAVTRSPAAAASPTGKASPTPRGTPAASPRATPAGRPHASPPTHRGATATPPARGGATGRPEATPPPAGRRGVTGSLPETQRSPAAAASPSEKATAPPRRERGTKRETGTPSERPGE